MDSREIKTGIGNWVNEKLHAPVAVYWVPLALLVGLFFGKLVLG